MPVPDHLSPSQAAMYLRCGVAWAYSYVEGIRTPRTGPLVRGTALDEAATLHYRGKARGHGLTREEFVQAAVATHESLIENEDVRLDYKPEQSRGIVERAAKAYFEKIAEVLKPRSYEDVQRKVSGEVDGVKVVGIVDLITAGGQVVDTKLKRAAPDGRSLDRDFQLGTYAWLTGARSLALAVATPDGRAQLVWTERDEADVERVKLIYSRVAACIQMGIAVPAAPDAWNCRPEWCGYWAMCPFGEGKHDGD